MLFDRQTRGVGVAVLAFRLGVASAVVVVVAGLAVGCGGKGSATTAAPAPTATAAASGSGRTTTSAAEESVPSVVYDYAASAGCLDQYSGAAGDNRGRDGAALVYTVRVPEDETEETDTGARLLFYPTEAQAKKHVADPGFLSANEKRLIGNVIVDGDAVRHPYAMQELIACLQF